MPRFPNPTVLCFRGGGAVPAPVAGAPGATSRQPWGVPSGGTTGPGWGGWGAPNPKPPRPAPQRTPPSWPPSLPRTSCTSSSRRRPASSSSSRSSTRRGWPESARSAARAGAGPGPAVGGATGEAAEAGPSSHGPMGAGRGRGDGGGGRGGSDSAPAALERRGRGQAAAEEVDHLPEGPAAVLPAGAAALQRHPPRCPAARRRLRRASRLRDLQLSVVSRAVGTQGRHACPGAQSAPCMHFT